MIVWLARTVLSCNRVVVNVTIKLDDVLCREARHRAVDADLSLSGWIAQIIRERIGMESSAPSRPTRLLDLLGDEKAAAVEFDPPRVAGMPEPAKLDG